MRWSALALIAAVTAVGVLDGTSTAQAFNDCDYYLQRCRGFVIPCSLDGVNPVFHPSIFGNPAVARAQYGFIRARDGTWQVEKNCVRGLNRGG